MPGKLKYHYGYVIIVCCCLIMGIDIGLVMSCAGVFYKPVSYDLGISVGDFGLYMAFIYALSFLTLSVAGKMMDRYSARWLLTASSDTKSISRQSFSNFLSISHRHSAIAYVGSDERMLMHRSGSHLVVKNKP